MTDTSPEWASEISEGHPLLDQLVRSNTTRIARIGRAGVGVDVTRAMLQHLLQTIYPEKAERQEYEVSFQKYLGEQLTVIEEQVAAMIQQQTLAVPPQGLVVPGQ